MRIIFTLVTMILFGIQGFSQCADEQNIYSFDYDGRSYELVMELKIWTNAAACAVERGGYLAELNSPEEAAAVFDAIVNGAKVSDNYVIVDDGAIGYVWIGATDQEEEGKWLWDGDDDKLGPNFWKGEGSNGAGDGEAVEEAYVNWGGSEAGTIQVPDNLGESGQQYGAIGLAGWPKGTALLGSAGEWNDLHGSNRLYYVIEYDPATSARPAGNDLKETVRIFPNPASEILYVRADLLERIEIFDMTGKRVGEYQTSPADISGFEKGAYLVRITSGHTTTLQKLMIR